MRRLLIRLPNWLGDVMMARPALHALRARFPGAEITMVGPAGPLELLRAEEASGVARPWPATGPDRARLAAELRREPADAAVVMPASFSSAWFAWRSGARARIGWAAEGRSPLLTRAVPRGPRGERHLADEYLALAAGLGAAPVPVPRLPVAESGRAGLRRLAGEDLAGRPCAILAPGAIYGPAKRWAPERFAAVGNARAALGERVVVCGAAEDREACDAVAGALAHPPLRLDGRTSLAELAALCAGARIVVCNDSGLGHVAAAVGAPVLAVFGSTSSAWTAPLGERVRVVQQAPVCSPCFRRTCAIGYRCLDAVSVARVERAARELAA